MTVYELIEHNFYIDSTTRQLFRNKDDAISKMGDRKAYYIIGGEMVTLEDSDTKVTLGWKPADVYATLKIIERKLL